MHARAGVDRMDSSKAKIGGGQSYGQGRVPSSVQDRWSMGNMPRWVLQTRDRQKPRLGLKCQLESSLLGFII